MGAAPKQQPPPEIKVDPMLLEAFVEGVKETVKTWAQVTVTAGTPSYHRPFESKGDVAGMVGMVFGDLKAILTISFEKGGLFKILGNMFGEVYTELNDEVAGAAGEFTNTIYGIAIEKLRGTKYDFNMTIPSVIVGQYKISSAHKGHAVCVPFSNGEINFYIELTVERRHDP